MVDIVKVLGDAPMERETAGTSGRTKVTTPDYIGAAIGIAQAGVGVVDEFRGKKINAQSEILERAALTGDAAVLDELGKDAEEFKSKIGMFESQGMSSEEVSRRRMQVRAALLKKYPGHRDKVLKATGVYSDLQGALTAATDRSRLREENLIEAETNQMRQASKMFGVDIPIGSTYEQTKEIYDAEIKPKVDEANKNKREYDALVLAKNKGDLVDQIAANENANKVGQALYETGIPQLKRRAEAIEDPLQRVAFWDEQIAELNKIQSNYKDMGADRLAVFGNSFSVIQAQRELAYLETPEAQAKYSSDKLEQLRKDAENRVKIKEADVDLSIVSRQQEILQDSETGPLLKDLAAIKRTVGESNLPTIIDSQIKTLVNLEFFPQMTLDNIKSEINNSQLKLREDALVQAREAGLGSDSEVRQNTMTYGAVVAGNLSNIQNRLTAVDEQGKPTLLRTMWGMVFDKFGLTTRAADVSRASSAVSFMVANAVEAPSPENIGLALNSYGAFISNQGFVGNSQGVDRALAIAAEPSFGVMMASVKDEEGLKIVREALKEEGRQRITEFNVRLQEDFQKKYGKFSERVSVSVDTKTNSVVFSNNPKSQRILSPKTLAKLNKDVNVMARARAHLNGHTNYLEEALDILEGGS